MSTKAGKSAEFLRNMGLAAQAAPQPVANLDAVPEVIAPAVEPPAPKRAGSRRAGLKHIGGYLDDPTVEKIALLRARLKLDNSELMKLAIEDLFRKEAAKRAFSDR